MLINPNNELELKKANTYYKKLVDSKSKFELRKISDSRNARQNRALHLYFSFISNELNELGMEFKYQGLVIEDLSSRYTSEIVKEFIWRPIQIALFKIKSTKDINTNQINEIIDVITQYFGEKDICLEFPCVDVLMQKI